MDEVILARHGESELSVVGRTNGDPATACALTETGRQEARRLGQMLAPARIDLCVVSEFQRAQETADLALEGRGIPRLVCPDFNDIRFGDFEGHALTEYRAWAHAHGPEVHAPGGGDSRAETVRRYIRGYRMILERPERKILARRTRPPRALHPRRRQRQGPRRGRRAGALRGAIPARHEGTRHGGGATGGLGVFTLVGPQCGLTRLRFYR